MILFSAYTEKNMHNNMRESFVFGMCGAVIPDNYN